jgi:zinc protease
MKNRFIHKSSKENEMKMKHHFTGRNELYKPLVLSCIFGIFILAQCSFAQFSPGAEEILDGYIRVTGGTGAYEKIENRMTHSEIEIHGSNIKLNITVMAQKPNLIRIVTESPVTGKVVSGCDGETVWELSDIKGPIIKYGKERENALHLNILDRFVHWREIYKKVEYRGLEKQNSKLCFVVYLEPYQADSQTLYFDLKTMLLVTLKTELRSDMGSLPVVSYFSDYREVDGVILPFETRIEMASQVMISRVKRMEHNVLLDQNFFALPEEIQPLLKQSG